MSAALLAWEFLEGVGGGALGGVCIARSGDVAELLLAGLLDFRAESFCVGRHCKNSSCDDPSLCLNGTSRRFVPVLVVWVLFSDQVADAVGAASATALFFLNFISWLSLACGCQRGQLDAAFFKVIECELQTDADDV